MVGELVRGDHAVSSFQARLAEEKLPLRMTPEAPERLPERTIDAALRLGEKPFALELMNGAHARNTQGRPQ